MTTNHSSYVPIQYPQHNFVQNAQVCTTSICDVPPLSYILMQTSSGRDHELWSNEHLPGIDSAGPHPAVNSIHFISLHAPFADGGCAEGPWTTSRGSKSTSP